MRGAGTKSPEADGVGHRPMILKAQHFEQASLCPPISDCCEWGSRAKPPETDDILLFKTSHFTPFLTSFIPFLRQIFSHVNNFPHFKKCMQRFRPPYFFNEADRLIVNMDTMEWTPL